MSGFPAATWLLLVVAVVPGVVVAARAAWRGRQGPCDAAGTRGPDA